MTTTQLVRLVFLAVIAAGLLAAASPAAGVWDCTATSPDGEAIKFTLTIQEEGGRLSGTVGTARGSMKIADLKFENSTLIFKSDYNGAVYTLELKVSGDKLEGTYRGDDASGPIKGARKP